MARVQSHRRRGTERAPAIQRRGAETSAGHVVVLLSGTGEPMRRDSWSLVIALGLAACVLMPIGAQTPAAPGQGDVFSSNAPQASPANADSCNAAYEQQMALASTHEGQVNAQWQADVAACHGDQTCDEAARQKRQTALGHVQTERVDAETAHGICEARRQLQGRASLDTDPCNAAYERQMELAYEHDARINDQWQKDTSPARATRRAPKRPGRSARRPSARCSRSVVPRPPHGEPAARASDCRRAPARAARTATSVSIRRQPGRRARSASPGTPRRPQARRRPARLLRHRPARLPRHRPAAHRRWGQVRGCRHRRA